MGRTGDRLGRALRVGTGTALLALGTGLFKSIQAAGNFEASLNTLEAVSGATGKQMKAISRLSKALGADLTLPGTSAKDAADAMTELAKGGLSVRDTMKAARATLQLSAAAQVDNATAARMTADALNTFNLSGDKAAHVADLLAASANATTAEIGDMSEGLTAAGSVAAQLGVTVDETITALGLFANAGIKGADAGTALKVMLLRLAAPTGKAKKVLDGLNISLFDQQGRMLPLRSIVDEFTTKTRGLSQEQRLQAANTIFGTRAIKALGPVLLAGTRGWDKMARAVGRQGAAADLAAAKMKGFRGSLEGFRSAAETLAITIGEPLLKAATKAVGKLSELVGFLDRVAQAKGTRLKFEIAVEGLGNLIDDIERQLLGGLERKPIRLPSGKVIEWETTETVGLVERLRDGIEDALASINWDRVGNRVVDGIAAGIEGGARLAKALVSLLDRAMDAIDWEAFGSKLGPGLASAFIAGLATLLDPGFWARHWEEMLAIAISAFPLGRVATLGRRLVAALVKPLERLAPEAGAAMGKGIDAVLRVAEALPGRLGRIFLGAVDAAAAAVQRLPGLVSAALKRVVDAISSRLGGLRGFLAKVIAWDALIRAVENAVKAVVDKIKDAANRIRGLLPSWREAALALALAVVTGVTGGLAGLIPALVAKISAAAQRVKAFAGTFFAYAFSLGSSIASGIISGLGDLASSIGSKIASGAKGALGIAKRAIGAGSPSKLAASEIGKPIADGILLGYLNGTADLPDKISDRLRKALDRARTTIDSRRTTLRTAFDRLASDAFRAFDARTDKLVSNLEKKLDQAKRAIDDALRADLASVEARRGALTPAERQLADLLSGREAADRARSIAEAQAALAEAQAGGDPAEILRAHRELDDALFEETRFQLEQRADLERQAADAEAETQITRLEAMAEQRRVAAEAEFEQRRLELESQRELERRHLEDFLAQQAEFLEKHPEQWRKVYKRIAKMFGDEFGPDLKTAGENLGKAFARGLREARNEVAAAARALAEEVERYLRLRSPAKAGPLASLDRWFEPFADTLLKGLDSAAIQRQLAAAVRAPSLATGGALAGAGGVVNLNVTVTGNTLLGDERETARQIARTLDPHLRQMTGFAFNR